MLSPGDWAAEVGDVVGALLERGALEPHESLVQPAEDPSRGRLGADSRFQFSLDLTG